MNDFLEDARQSFGLKKSAAGAWLCQRCESVELTDDGHLFQCLSCRKITEKEDAEREQKREQTALQNARRATITMIERAPVWGQCPQLPPDLSKMPEGIRRMVDRYQAKQSLLISGQPGSWKTMGCVALLHRIKRDAIQAAENLTHEQTTGLRMFMSRDQEHADSGFRVRPPTSPRSPRDPIETILGAVWVSAFDLVQARRQHPLGRKGDAELIVWAKNASLLIVDEAGPQAQADRDQVLMEVIDARYGRRAPTIATTGQSPAEFQIAHGAGLWRRLTEDGVGKLLRPKAEAA